MDGHERPSNRVERLRVRPSCPGQVFAQGHDREEADEADADDGGLHDTAGDIAKGEPFVLPLEDGISASAVPMLAMMRMTSQNAPNRTRASALEPAMEPVSLRTGS